MNVFLLNPNVYDSCRELARIDPVRARKQLVECCQLLASIEWKLTGKCTMVRADGQTYKMAHPHHPCVTHAISSFAQYDLTFKVAYELSWEFPNHASAESFWNWGRLRSHPNHRSDYVIVRRGFAHRYVDNLADYVRYLRPYFMEKTNDRP